MGGANTDSLSFYTNQMLEIIQIEIELGHTHTHTQKRHSYRPKYADKNK